MTSAFSQLLRFGIVGVLANLSLYMVYLALVFMGLAPIWAMTTAFLMGVVVSFVFNAKWTFDASTSADAFRRMLVCYFAAWLGMQSRCMCWLMGLNGPITSFRDR